MGSVGYFYIACVTASHAQGDRGLCKTPETSNHTGAETNFSSCANIRIEFATELKCSAMAIDQEPHNISIEWYRDGCLFSHLDYAAQHDIAVVSSIFPSADGNYSCLVADDDSACKAKTSLSTGAWKVLWEVADAEEKRHQRPTPNVRAKGPFLHQAAQQVFTKVCMYTLFHCKRRVLGKLAPWHFKRSSKGIIQFFQG